MKANTVRGLRDLLCWWNRLRGTFFITKPDCNVSVLCFFC